MLLIDLVARRHYNFGHGIGRSGDLLEAQPKAAGSTIINALTNDLLTSLFQELGFNKGIKCFLVPMATGMTITLSLLALKKTRPNAKYVIWSRIDQKACFKSISTAGFTPIVIEPLITEDGLETNIEEFETKISALKNEEILAIYSTTSCFAPRNPDNIVKLSLIAGKHEIPHIINNAYGLQDASIIKNLNRAAVKGRLDMVIQSTDKNLLVPVGGAIVASFHDETLETVSKTYSGRASISQTLDVLMTMLSLGRKGLTNLITERVTNFDYLRNEIGLVAKKYGQNLISSSRNNISLAISLNFEREFDLQLLGSMLFKRGVSGTRVITCKENKTIDSLEFKNWGSHSSETKISYLTAAVALGCQKEEIDVFIRKLDKCLEEVLKEIKTN